MGPAVKLAYDLIEGEAGLGHAQHHLVRGHAGHAEVRGAAQPVLAGVLGAHRVVDGLGPEGGGYYDRPAPEEVLERLQQYGEAPEVD